MMEDNLYTYTTEKIFFKYILPISVLVALGKNIPESIYLLVCLSGLKWRHKKVFFCRECCRFWLVV